MMGTPAQRLQADRLTFPGMLPDEIVTWKAWLKLHEKEYERYDYNVRVGPGLPVDPKLPPNLQKMVADITRLRIDVVAWNGQQPTIIEVKRRAKPSEIGQLLAYKHAWDAEHPDLPPALMRLVCNSFSPNIPPAIARLGIPMDVVEADYSILAPVRSL